MDATVSARLPVELKDSVYDALAQDGISPTELIRSAFLYYRENRALPFHGNEVQPGRRILDEQAARELLESIERASYPVDPAFFEGKTDDDLLEEALYEAYAALA